jgi:hypothetical protein
MHKLTLAVFLAVFFYLTLYISAAQEKASDGRAQNGKQVIKAGDDSGQKSEGINKLSQILIGESIVPDIESEAIFGIDHIIDGF